MNKMKERNLPIFGVGPIYVISCCLLTIVGMVLKFKGKLGLGDIPELHTIMLVIGFMLISFGIALWVKAVVLQRISEEIKNGKLVTEGVYSVVRNPIYSAFLFIFSGILIIANNLFLLILPVIFWLLLTLLMKVTEEKWLKKKFGQEYIQYCKKVNRVIPWFR